MSNNPTTTTSNKPGNGGTTTPATGDTKAKAKTNKLKPGEVMLAIHLKAEEVDALDKVAKAIGGVGVHISRATAGRAAILRYMETSDYKSLTAPNA